MIWKLNKQKPTIVIWQIVGNWGKIFFLCILVSIHLFLASTPLWPLGLFVVVPENRPIQYLWTIQPQMSLSLFMNKEVLWSIIWSERLLLSRPGSSAAAVICTSSELTVWDNSRACEICGRANTQKIIISFSCSQHNIPYPKSSSHASKLHNTLVLLCWHKVCFNSHHPFYPPCPPLHGINTLFSKILCFLLCFPLLSYMHELLALHVIKGGFWQSYHWPTAVITKSMHSCLWLTRLGNVITKVCLIWGAQGPPCETCVFARAIPATLSSYPNRVLGHDCRCTERGGLWVKNDKERP